MAFYDATETGSLTSRLQADCQAVTRCVATNLNIILRNALQAIGRCEAGPQHSPAAVAAAVDVAVAVGVAGGVCTACAPSHKWVSSKSVQRG